VLLPGSFSVALALMLVSMVCWGSWTNTWRIARRWQLEFYHCDWAVGAFLAAAVAAAVGVRFAAPDFFHDVRDAGSMSLLCAAAGGAALNLGNFFLMAAIARVGMAVAFPIACGLALVVSTLLSYWIHPLGDAALLAGGVALVFCAVITNSLAYRSMTARAAHKPNGGLAMCLAAGVLFSICTPLAAKAFASPQPLSPYGAGVIYTAGSLVATVPLMLFLQWRPLDGDGFSLRRYVAGSRRDHAAGLAGGFIWGTAMALNYAAAAFAGMAVAGAVGQANPLVAAIWGVFIWREFRGSSRRTYVLLTVMAVLYAGGLLTLGYSFRNL
jgi:glucose uptake protein